MSLTRSKTNARIRRSLTGPTLLLSFLMAAPVLLAQTETTPTFGRIAAVEPAAAAQKNPLQATWKGILPGVSGRRDVEAALGAPSHFKPTLDGGEVLTYPPLEQFEYNQISLNPQGIVVEVAIGKFKPGEAPSFSSLTMKHGQPQMLANHSLRDPHGEQQIYKFGKDVGLWVIADMSSDLVFSASFYDPAHEPDIPLPKPPAPGSPPSRH